MREEEPSLGIDQPPLAAHLLGAEEAYRRKLRSARPAAILVGLGNWTGMFLEPGVLGHAGGGKFTIVVNLAGPVVVDELAESVHERQKGLGGQHLPLLAHTRHRHTLHAEPARQKDVEGMRPPQVEGRARIRRPRITPHAIQLQRRVKRPRHVVQQHTHLAGGVRQQHDHATGGLPLYRSALHAQMHHHRLVRRIAHGDRHVPVSRQITFAGDEVHAHARPAVLHAGCDTHCAIAQQCDARIRLRA